MNMNKKNLILIAILLLSSTVVIATESDTTSNSPLDEWWMFGGDTGYTRYTSANAPANISNTVVITKTLPYTVTGSPLVVGDYVYLHPYNYNYAKLYKFNALNISELIENSTNTYTIQGRSPTYFDESFYIHYSTSLVQVNASNLSQMIDSESIADAGYYATPTVYNNSVIVGDGNYNPYIRAFNSSNISQVLSGKAIPSRIYESTPVKNGYAYVASSGAIYQLNASNLSQQVAVVSCYANSIEYTFPVSSEYIYKKCTNGDGSNIRLTQFNASNVSQQIANYTLGASSIQPPVVNGNYLFVAAGSIMYQLDASDVSQLIGSYTAGSTINGAPIIAKGFLYFGAQDSKLYQLGTYNPLLAINIDYPEDNEIYLNVTEINYTLQSDEITFESCWYSNSSGVWNSDAVSAGNNFTGINSVSGWNNWVLYCNDTEGNNYSSEFDFAIDDTNPSFVLIENQTIQYLSSLSYEISASDDLEFSCFSVNDTTNFAIDCSGNLENNTVLSVGEYWLNITINDSVGHENSETMFVNVTPRSVINLDVITPTGNFNINQNEFFEVSVNITCLEANCGEINVTLDPISGTGSNYTAYNESEGLGDSFEWEEIIGNGGVALWDGSNVDDSYVAAPMNFNFSFYGINYSTVYVSSNGRVHFTTASAGSTSLSVPSSSYKMIAPVNRDMYVRSTRTKVYYKNETNPDRTIIQYDNLDYYSGGPINLSYQVILYADGKIKIQYNNSNSDYSGSSNTGLNNNATDYLFLGIDAPDQYKNAAITLLPPGYSGTLKSGTVSMTEGDSPFYTNITNPYNLSLNIGETETITWYVNATGTLDTTHEFFVYANQTADQSISNITSTWNVTIVEEAISPIVVFNSPTPDNNKYSTDTSIEINSSIIEENLDEIKYSWDNTNYTHYEDYLVLMYNFDNVSMFGENDTHIVDFSISGKNGTGINGANYNSSGKYGGAYDFDGVDDKITIPTTFGIQTTGFTVSGWVNLDSDSESGAFVKIGGTSPNQGFGIGVGETSFDNNGNNLIILYEGVRWIDTNVDIGTGWHHVVLCVDGSGYPKAFIDGEIVYQDSSGAGAAPQSSTTYIGGYTGATGENRHTDVMIDEVRIWNRELNDNEIYQQYVSNLRKIDFDSWELYINQSKNATDVLENGTYTYFIYAKDDSGNANQTETRNYYLNVLDTDGDLIPDGLDPLLYNETNVIKTGVDNLDITIGGNPTNQSYLGVNEIRFNDGENLIMNFSYNFSASILDLSKIQIIKNANYTLVNLSDQLQTEHNKTLHIADNNFTELCVKDAEISSISEMSGNCDGLNETNMTLCLGNNTGYSNNRINCLDSGETISISNLRFSAIRGTPGIIASTTPTTSGGGGGGSKFTKYECTKNSDCDADYSCYENKCVKLFDVEIILINSTIDHLDFDLEYLVKGMAEINSDVIIEFWIEDGGGKIMLGKDTIYLGSFEEKRKTTILNLPSEIKDGSYDLYVQSGYEKYRAQSFRKINILIPEETRIEEEEARRVEIRQNYFTWWIIGILLVLIILLLIRKTRTFILGGILYIKRKIISPRLDVSFRESEDEELKQEEKDMREKIPMEEIFTRTIPISRKKGALPLYYSDNIVRMRDLFEKEVFTTNGNLIGTIERSIVSKNKVLGWVIRPDKKYDLNKDIFIKHKYVVEIKDIFLINSKIEDRLSLRQNRSFIKMLDFRKKLDEEMK